MPGTRPPYPATFWQQMVDLVRSGRYPNDLVRRLFDVAGQSAGLVVRPGKPGQVG